MRVDCGELLLNVLEGACVAVGRLEGEYGAHSGGTTSCQLSRIVHDSMKVLKKPITIRSDMQRAYLSGGRLTFPRLCVGALLEYTMRVKEFAAFDSRTGVAHAFEIGDITRRESIRYGFLALG